MAHASRIDCEGFFGWLLAIVDKVKRRRVYNAVRTRRIKQGLNGPGVADFQLLVGNRHYFIWGEETQKVLRQLPVCADQQDSHSPAPSALLLRTNFSRRSAKTQLVSCSRDHAGSSRREAVASKKQWSKAIYDV